MIVLVAGCGGDDEGGASTAQTEQTTTTAPAETETTPATETEGTTETEPPAGTDTSGSGGAQPPVSGEDKEGGGGDEQGAHSQALLTGRGGRITPRVVRVPPFISVEVVLRSGDGQTYGLSIGGRRLRAGGEIGSATVRLPGLRAGKAYVGTETDTGVRIRIEATAEPGP